MRPIRPAIVETRFEFVQLEVLDVHDISTSLDIERIVPTSQNYDATVNSHVIETFESRFAVSTCDGLVEPRTSFSNSKAQISTHSNDIDAEHDSELACIEQSESIH